MRILVIVGSEKINGNTDKLCKAFIGGAAENGNTAVRFHLGEHHINGCRGCNACKSTGKCVIDDGFSDFVEEFRIADMIVFASPLYFWGISSQLKALIDRFYSIGVKSEKGYYSYPKKKCMSLPQVTYAWEILESGNGSVNVRREVDDGFEIVKLSTPCLITFTKPTWEPRMATIKGKLAANRAQINVLTAEDIPMDLTRAGLKGSPTKVKSTFTPEVKTGGIKIKEESEEASAAKLAGLLIDAKLI